MTKADKMVHLLNPERFDEVFEIMKSSFPEDEYRTYEEQRRCCPMKNIKFML